jgi:hypothetical protein
MARLFNILLSCLILSTLSSCTKEKVDFELEISGIVQDDYLQKGIEGAEALLLVRESNMQAQSFSFTKKAETITGANGSFKFKFMQGDAIEYKLEISKEGYFSKTILLNSDDVSPKEGYHNKFPMAPKIHVQVKAKNNNFFNDFDKITIYTFTENTGCNCCKANSYELTGRVDTSFSCILSAPQNYKIAWRVERENFNNVPLTTEGIQCVPHNNNLIEINF